MRGMLACHMVCHTRAQCQLLECDASTLKRVFICCPWFLAGAGRQERAAAWQPVGHAHTAQRRLAQAATGWCDALTNQRSSFYACL
jgi:hypothetical protein